MTLRLAEKAGIGASAPDITSLSHLRRRPAARPGKHEREQQQGQQTLDHVGDQVFCACLLFV